MDYNTMDEIIGLIYGYLEYVGKDSHQLKFGEMNPRKRSNLLLLKVAFMLKSSGNEYVIKCENNIKDRIRLYYKIYHKLGRYKYVKNEESDNLIYTDDVVEYVFDVLAKEGKKTDITFDDIYEEYYEI